MHCNNREREAEVLRKSQGIDTICGAGFVTKKPIIHPEE